MMPENPFTVPNADSTSQLLQLGFINEMALVLYVYLPSTRDGEESCLTVSDCLRNVPCQKASF